LLQHLHANTGTVGDLELEGLDPGGGEQEYEWESIDAE